jgi:hypothetical protein
VPYVWQPIATAPLDGTDILCWQDGECFIAGYFLGRWWTDSKSFLVDGLPQCQPEYWIPLPDAPHGGFTTAGKYAPQRL